jgi:hypothetical protein
MPQDFLPRREDDLLVWSANFAQHIQPDPLALGLTSAQCAAYQAKHDAFAALYREANEPRTRTHPVITAKDESREALLAEARLLGRIIRAHPGVTAQQRINLGLSAPPGKGTAIAPPEKAPVLHVEAVIGRALRVRVRDAESPTKRGKPRGVANVVIFSVIADEPPASLDGWSLHTSIGRTKVDLTFGGHVAPGAKVWLAAAWTTARGLHGPVSTPVPAIIGIGGPAITGLKLAA